MSSSKDFELIIVLFSGKDKTSNPLPLDFLSVAKLFLVNFKILDLKLDVLHSRWSINYKSALHSGILTVWGTGGVTTLSIKNGWNLCDHGIAVGKPVKMKKYFRRMLCCAWLWTIDFHTAGEAEFELYTQPNGYRADERNSLTDWRAHNRPPFSRDGSHVPGSGTQVSSCNTSVSWCVCPTPVSLAVLSCLKCLWVCSMVSYSVSQDTFVSEILFYKGRAFQFAPTF